MKITVEVLPESEAIRCVYALMQRASFKEIDRVVVGGHSSSVMIVITFQGEQQTFDMLKNNIYIEMPFIGKSLNKMFYSLTCLTGVSFQDVEAFRDYLEKQIMSKPEIRYLSTL